MDDLRVSGIYDTQVIKALENLGVKKFAFDLRPKSFNFVQSHVIKEIIHQVGNNNTYYLQFDLDKDFVIEQTLEELKKAGSLIQGSFKVELTSFRSLATLKHLPLCVHVNDTKELLACAEANVSSVVIKNSTIEFLENQNKLFPFLQEVFALGQDQFSVEILNDWSESISQNVIDFYPFNTMVFELNSKVESSYRCVNLHLVCQHIEHIKRDLDLN